MIAMVTLSVRSVAGAISDFVLVTFVLCAIMAILLVIGWGSARLRSRREKGSSLDALEHETEKFDGITSHSLFYGFFFRRGRQ